MQKEIDSKVQKQLSESIANCLERLDEQADDLFALWALALLARHSSQKPAGTQKAVQARLDAFALIRKREGDTGLSARLRATNAPAFLEELWAGLHDMHFEGALLCDIAKWLCLLVPNEAKLAKLAWLPDYYNPGWGAVGRTVVVAVEILASTVLAKDPSNTSALSLYADESFLMQLNYGRKKADWICGPPVPKQAPEHWLAKLNAILSDFERGASPLKLFVEMDLVPVDHPDIVQRLIAGLDCAAWRGQAACCEALGRARVAQDLAVAALARMLEHGEESVREKAVEALRDLRKKQ